ncbi:MAG TPA: ABC transporter permease [Desulfobacterales bacterium]
MSVRWHTPMIFWAVRDVLRRPGESALVIVAMLATIIVLAVPLLLTQATATTAMRILADAPDLVLRRVNIVGWEPLPAEEARRLAEAVPGITAAEARIWGVVNGPLRPVTVIAVPAEPFENIRLPITPATGQAVVGPGVIAGKPAASIELRGRDTRTLEVISMMEADSGTVSQDLVFTSAEDARALLGLPPGYASDLALEVFFPGEAEALIPDLAEAFPWPVQISTRAEAAGFYAAAMARRGAISTVAMIPSLLAIALLVAAVVRQHLGRRHEIGLLKSMGWTSRDIVRVQVVRALVIGVPATAIGMLLSSLLVFWPGVSWPASLLLGWETAPPQLVLDTSGAVPILLVTAGLVLLPFLTATLVPSLKASTADPLDLLEREMP